MEEEAFMALIRNDNEGKGFRAPEDQIRLAYGSEVILARIEADIREHPSHNTQEELAMLARCRQLIAIMRGHRNTTCRGQSMR